MSKFIEVLFQNQSKEIFSLSMIVHLIPAGFGRVDVFLITKDKVDNNYDYNLDIDYDTIKLNLISVASDNELPIGVQGKKIVKGSFDVQNSIK